jgi:DNA-binding response OmpR family regulator
LLSQPYQQPVNIKNPGIMAKILIVEDCPELLEFLEVLMKHNNFDTEAAYSKTKAAEKLSLFTPDIILLDVMLHGEDGREICKAWKLNEQYKHIPIILLSANPKLLEGYKECYAVDVIEKPFQINTILEKINKHLNNNPHAVA